MASKINKKSSLTIKGIYSIEDGKIFINVEDMDEPIDLISVSTEYIDKEVTVSISQNTELM